MTAVAPDLIAFANRLADASGKVIRPLFRQRIDVTHKQGKHAFDPVTEADRGAERALRDLIARERPDDAILGEEFGETQGTSGYRWVLDPVDGTRAFITGRHEWGSLIALEDKGVPVLGILDQPVLGERFIGVNGTAYLVQEGRSAPLRTRECASLSDAILCATDPQDYFSGPELERFARVKSKVRMTRYGGDCYGYCLLAAGFVDLVVEAGLKAHDVVALIPIIERAGGRITTWEGRSAVAGGAIIAAGDARLHEEALAVLAK